MKIQTSISKLNIINQVQLPPQKIHLIMIWYNLQHFYFIKFFSNWEYTINIPNVIHVFNWILQDLVSNTDMLCLTEGIVLNDVINTIVVTRNSYRKSLLRETPRHLRRQRIEFSSANRKRIMASTEAPSLILSVNGIVCYKLKKYSRDK